MRVILGILYCSGSGVEQKRRIVRARKVRVRKEAGLGCAGRLLLSLVFVITYLQDCPIVLL